MFTDRDATTTSDVANSPRDRLSPSALVAAVEQWLSRGFPVVRVRGEVSGLTRAASGHSYFSIKDDSASVRCVLFRQRTGTVIPSAWGNGDVVDISARVAIYAARGDLQLIVESVRPAGQGDLHAAFIALRERLKAEGLFDESRKRALPVFVRRVALVTSPDAAVLRDIATTFARRAPHVELLLFPAAVQGAHAAAELITALQAASDYPDVDCVILARGGGSIDDLAAFNDEALARRIAISSVPIVSAVGHETDFSISDFVADVRAPTPTAAAELCATPRDEWLTRVGELRASSARAMDRRLQALAQSVDLLGAKLLSPAQQVRLNHAALQERALRIRASLRACSAHTRDALGRWHQRLANQRPEVQTRMASLADLRARLRGIGASAVGEKRAEVASLTAQLHALGPMGVLRRGYVLVTRIDGTPLTSSLSAAPGEAVTLTWHDGSRNAALASDVNSERKQ
jgi:exodeoxyribonuclease VII large subunit